MLQAPLPLRRPWPNPEPRNLSIPAGMRRERFRAMGTTISLLLPVAQASVGSAAVYNLFARWEQTLSRFRHASELCALNARAGTAVALSPLLFRAIETALEAAHATDGLFDPTMLRQLVVLGYDRSFETLPPQLPHALSMTGPGGGWRDVRLGHAYQTVTLPHGIGLDLGGIAKGMAVDAALAVLRTLGVETALVNAGGDLAVLGELPDGEPWPIAVPTHDGSQTVALTHGAIATSSTAARRWRQGAQQCHHLLDPRSGESARSGLRSVSVGAATCAQAEVAAKVACILGSQAGADFLRAHDLAGLLVHESGAWRVTCGWPLPITDGGAA